MGFNEALTYTLVRVGEGRDVASTDDSVGKRVEAGRFSVGRLGLVEVSEESILLVELREDTGEVSTLLSSDLGGRSVVGGYETRFYEYSLGEFKVM